MFADFVIQTNFMEKRYPCINRGVSSMCLLFYLTWVFLTWILILNNGTIENNDREPAPYRCSSLFHSLTQLKPHAIQIQITCHPNRLYVLDKNQQNICGLINHFHV